MEKAPWRGGFCEQMMHSVKACLKKHMERSSLKFEELQTNVEIKALLNNLCDDFINWRTGKHIKEFVSDMTD